MRIYDLATAAGPPYAFEISNLLLSRHRAYTIVAPIPGVRILRAPRRWRLHEPDDFCEFELGGFRFALSEPFGDNPRYWVGPQPLHPNAPLDTVRTAFATRRPGPSCRLANERRN